VGSSDSDPADPLAGLRRPRIGLSTYVETVSWSVWEEAAAFTPRSYVDSVLDAGGLPVLLPPPGEAVGPEAAPLVLEGLAGLVVVGGADVEPGRYGAAAHPEAQDPRPDRDDWETRLLHLALDRDLPVLAICRGMQVLNVALGGALHQHLPDVAGHQGHCPIPGVFGTTRVLTAPESMAAEILGAEVKVRCHHHQAIDRLAAGLTAVAWADDGTIEAAVVDGRHFAMGVQWHPEEGDDPRLFTAFVAAARSATRP
jgi:gamma-glutamyl-gamma-aminobutyrate hydrolase PuuD